MYVCVSVYMVHVTYQLVVKTFDQVNDLLPKKIVRNVILHIKITQKDYFHKTICENIVYNDNL